LAFSTGAFFTEIGSSPQSDDDPKSAIPRATLKPPSVTKTRSSSFILDDFFMIVLASSMFDSEDVAEQDKMDDPCLPTNLSFGLCRRKGATKEAVLS
jgi:hypothetical protein